MIMSGVMLIAKKTIEYYENFDAFCEWLKKLHRAGVLKELEIKHEEKLVKMKGQATGGLCKGLDPINAFVLLSTVLFNVYWIYLPDAKEAFEVVKKWYREKVKRREPLHSEDLERDRKRPEKSLLDFVEGS